MRKLLGRALFIRPAVERQEILLRKLRWDRRVIELQREQFLHTERVRHFHLYFVRAGVGVLRPQRDDHVAAVDLVAKLVAEIALAELGVPPGIEPLLLKRGDEDIAGGSSSRL